LTTVLRTTVDLITLRTKGVGEVKLERSRLATSVVKKDTMLMNVGIHDLLVSTVRSRVTFLEIARLQKRDRQ
ncbi:hypothetical protein A2U01_0072647, partial [Trifolium medium]|nr:hypothetical protein [Trifolium medium]